MGSVGTAQGVPPTPPAETRQKMIDCRVLTQDGTRLEAQGLCTSPELEMAYRQGEQWDAVSNETLARHYSKRMRHNR